MSSRAHLLTLTAGRDTMKGRTLHLIAISTSLTILSSNSGCDESDSVMLIHIPESEQIE